MLGFDFGKAVSIKRYDHDFEQIDQIGSGGFSAVYRVKNKRDDSELALKIVKIKPSHFKRELSDELQKILSEAKVLSHLNHPNVLRFRGSWIEADLENICTQQQPDLKEEDDIEMVFDDEFEDSCGIEFEKNSNSSKKKQSKKQNTSQFTDSTNDNFFGTNLRSFKQIRIKFLSELGQCSLQKYIQERNKKNIENNAERRKNQIQNYLILLDVIEGLNYIHHQKIIHRDIKLQNIVLGKDGKFKIIDFGLAKRVRAMKSLLVQTTKDEFQSEEDYDEHHSKSIGTKIFSSPEQTNSNSYDHRTDIYSFALVAAIIFSNYQTLHEQIEILTQLRNKFFGKLKINQSLKELLIRCLGEQKMRPSLIELKRNLKKILREALCGQQNHNELKLGGYCYHRNGFRLQKRVKSNKFGASSNLFTKVPSNQEDDIIIKT